MVAVILVNYNGAADTISCLKSLSAIHNVEFEIIVVDNCSTDDSIQRLQKYRESYPFTLLQSDTNRGFSAGNNIGIRYAENADYYLLLNNDTIVEADFLKKLLKGFESGKDCGITTPQIRYYSEPDKIWYAGGSLNPRTGRTEHYHYNEILSDSNLSSCKVSFASGCCLCIARRVVDTVGVLNEDFFLYEEDAEYCLRVVKAGFEIHFVLSSLIYHKVSATTGAGSTLSQYYSVRNKYYLIWLHYEGTNRLAAYTYCTVQFLFRCIKKELYFKNYRRGLKAFLRKEIGKTMDGNQDARKRS